MLGAPFLLLQHALCFFFFLQYSFSLHILWRNRHLPQPSPPFLHHSFLFPSLCFFFLSTQFTEAMEWLPGSPGVAPELQVRRPEVAELSVAVEGDSPWWNINISPYWFTAVWPNMTQYWANWGMSPSLFVLFVITKGKKTAETSDTTGFHCTIRKWKIIYYSALQRQRAVKEKLRKKSLKFIGWQANCVTDRKTVMPSFYTL